MNGCILILVALGLSIVFGLMGIINFAHGVFYMLGAYAGWLTVHITGSFWLALAVAPVTVASSAPSWSAACSSASTEPRTRTSRACW